jgi:hypothetical protein
MPRREAGSIIIVWLHPVFQYISWKRHNYGSVSLLGLYRCTNQIKPAHRRVFFCGRVWIFQVMRNSDSQREIPGLLQAWSTHKAPKTTVLKQTTGTCWDMLDIGILSASHVRCQREIIACSVTFALRLFRVR